MPMDPIELIQSLPPRQRATLYAKAIMRMAIPAMPWPVWMSICGVLAGCAMVAAWLGLAPNLPPLGAHEAMLAMALMIPAIAIDAILRRIPRIKRSRMGYMAAPLLAAAAFCAWVGMVESPWARETAMATSRTELAVKAEALLAQAQEQYKNSAAGDEKAVIDGLRFGLARAKKVEAMAKPTFLPPLPMPAGGAEKSGAKDSVSNEEREREAIELATSAAMGMIQGQSKRGQTALKNSATQATLLTSELSSVPAVAPAEAQEASDLFLAAMALSWLGSPILALILGHGILASLLAPFQALWRAALGCGHMAGRAARPSLAKILAPGPDELADLQRRVDAHRSVEAYRSVALATEHVDTHIRHAGSESSIELSGRARAPTLDDLEVSFERSVSVHHIQAAAHAPEEPAAIAG